MAKTKKETTTKVKKSSTNKGISESTNENLRDESIVDEINENIEPIENVEKESNNITPIEDIISSSPVIQESMDIMQEYQDAAKNIDNVMVGTTPVNELKEFLENEKEKATESIEKMANVVSELEKKLEKQKKDQELIRKYMNQTNTWNGVTNI